MNGRWILFVWVMAVTIAITDAAAQDEKLSYRSDRDARSTIKDLGSQQLDVTTEEPLGVELPEFKRAQPVFAKWMTPMAPQGYVWFALDRSSIGGPYDNLYIDSNIDGSLKDQTPITSWSIEQNRSNFGPVAVVFPGKDGPITYHLNLSLNNLSNQKIARVTTACWYEGQITVGGVKRDCMLVDYNANGAFDDKSLDHQEADRLWLKRDQDKWGILLVGSSIPIDQKNYRLDVSHGGAQVTLTEATDMKFGGFRVPAGLAKITFVGENGKYVFSNGEVTGQLPVGRYQVAEWAIEQKDGNGRLWRILANGKGKVILDIEESKEVSLAVGWPIAPKLAVQQGGRNYRMTYSIAGQLGEQLNITCNGKRPPVPKVRITNASKSYSQVVNLKYG